MLWQLRNNPAQPTAVANASAQKLVAGMKLMPGFQAELLAAEPDLVTPIGCAVDPQGRIYVVESHTHFRQPDYPGPKSDRILRFPATPGAKPTVVVSEDLRWSMQLAYDAAGRLLMTHRNGLVRFEVGDAAPVPAPLGRHPWWRGSSWFDARHASEKRGGNLGVGQPEHQERTADHRFGRAVPQEMPQAAELQQFHVHGRSHQPLPGLRVPARVRPAR